MLIPTTPTTPNRLSNPGTSNAAMSVTKRSRSEMSRYIRKLDLVINTVSVAHGLDPYINLLKRDGAWC